MHPNRAQSVQQCHQQTPSLAATPVQMPPNDPIPSTPSPQSRHPSPTSPPPAARPTAAAAAASAPYPRLPTRVRIVEVAPRDGLQNESQLVDTSRKVQLIHDLVDAGLRCVEVTAFVSPKWVPQLRDASDVMTRIEKQPGVSYPVLVPNRRGLDAAIRAGADEIAVFASATETFSTKNVNCTVAQSLARFAAVAAAARAASVRVRGYVSCVVACPYEGPVSPAAVAAVARALYDMGCYEISLGDTIGAGNPKSIVAMIKQVVRQGVPVAALAIHCHDTRGMALANVLAAMSVGVAVVDSSVAGLGGCPFAPGATGNLATEDLVYMLQGMDIDIGPIDLRKLVAVGERICQHLNRPSGSRVATAMLTRCHTQMAPYASRT